MPGILNLFIMTFTDEQISNAYNRFSRGNKMSKINFNLAVKNLINPNEKTIPIRVLPAAIISNAAQVFDISKEKILGKCRQKQYVKSRIFISYFLRTNGFTLHEIGKVLNKDHSSIIHHITTFENEASCDEQYKKDYEYFKSINL